MSPWKATKDCYVCAVGSTSNLGPNEWKSLLLFYPLGFPNVTVAPDYDVESSQGPIVQKCDPPTQLSLLSDSVMDPQVVYFPCKPCH